MSLLDDLHDTRRETLAHFTLPDADLARTYGPGKWSVRYLLHHLSDSETVFLYRIRRVISEPKQFVFAYDQSAWATELDYSAVPLELSQRLFESSRDAVIYLAARHYEQSERKTFVHSETGPRTLKDEFEKVVSHNRKHLDHIAQALR